MNPEDRYYRKEPEDGDQLLTLANAAKLLDFGRTYGEQRLRYLVENGEIPAVSILVPGSARPQTRVWRSDVLSWASLLPRYKGVLIEHHHKDRSKHEKIGYWFAELFPNLVHVCSAIADGCRDLSVEQREALPGYRQHLDQLRSLERRLSLVAAVDVSELDHPMNPDPIRQKAAEAYRKMAGVKTA